MLALNNHRQLSLDKEIEGKHMNNTQLIEDVNKNRLGVDLACSMIIRADK